MLSAFIGPNSGEVNLFPWMATMAGRLITGGSPDYNSYRATSPDAPRFYCDSNSGMGQSISRQVWAYLSQSGISGSCGVAARGSEVW